MMNQPRTVEDILLDFKNRRAGIIKALTKDVEKFYRLCDPRINPQLCLYGLPNQEWKVDLPSRSELPEPRLGINLDREDMTRQEWLSKVAFHSEAWLHAVAAYYAAKYKFDKADRKRLFNKITDVRSICDEVMAEGTRKKVNAFLSEEMLLEVFSRLPVRDLLRYRSVCKRWLVLIDDSKFASEHLLKYKSNDEGSHLLVIELPRRGVKHEQTLVRRSDTFRKVMEFRYLNGQDMLWTDNLMTYLNGVVLVTRGSGVALREIILWNPSIHKCLNVPDSVFKALREASYFELGLGFDALDNDYKVIAIVYPHAELTYHHQRRYHVTVPGLIQVYTLSSNSWTSKLGVEPPPYWTVGRQIFVNGAIHWTNLGSEPGDDDGWRTKRDTHIVAFDVTNELFNYFELPSEIAHGNDPIQEKFPVTFEGSLGMFCIRQSHIDIWVMEEYGVSDSWSKRYKFALNFNKILHFKSNGELLFALDGNGIKSYHVKRKRLRDLAKTYCRSSKYTVYTYVESLGLLTV